MYIHYEILDGITYPFANFNYAAVEVWEWISNFIQDIPIFKLIWVKVEMLQKTCISMTEKCILDNIWLNQLSDMLMWRLL